MLTSSDSDLPYLWKYYVFVKVVLQELFELTPSSAHRIAVTTSPILQLSLSFSIDWSFISVFMKRPDEFELRPFSSSHRDATALPCYEIPYTARATLAWYIFCHAYMYYSRYFKCFTASALMGSEMLRLDKGDGVFHYHFSISADGDGVFSYHNLSMSADGFGWLLFFKWTQMAILDVYSSSADGDFDSWFYSKRMAFLDDCYSSNERRWRFLTFILRAWRRFWLLILQQAQTTIFHYSVRTTRPTLLVKSWKVEWAIIEQLGSCRELQSRDIFHLQCRRCGNLASRHRATSKGQTYYNNAEIQHLVGWPSFHRTVYMS